MEERQVQREHGRNHVGYISGGVGGFHTRADSTDRCIDGKQERKGEQDRGRHVTRNAPAGVDRDQGRAISDEKNGGEQRREPLVASEAEEGVV